MPTPDATPIFPVDYAAHAAALPFTGRLSCDAVEVVAGELSEITLAYEVGAAGLADGAWLKVTFRFYSDWALFQTERPNLPDYVSAELIPRPLLAGETPSPLPALDVKFDQKGHERPFQKALRVDLTDGFLRPGDRIILRLGDRRGGCPGTRVQSFADDDFRFRAYLDPVGTSRFAPVAGDVVLKIVPGPPAAVRVRTPRLVRVGEAFPVTIAAEDAWGNACRPDGVQFALTTTRPEGGAGVPPALNSSNHAGGTPAPRTDGGTVFLAPGDAATPRWAAARTMMTCDAPGEYLLRAALVSDGPSSAPVPVTAEAGLEGPRAFFADLHVHSSNTVGTNSTEYNLSYGRDVAGLDVFGYTANDFNITAARWQADVALCGSFTRDGEYLCYAGTEWNGNSAAGGDRNVIFFGDALFPQYNGASVRSFEWNEDMAGDSAIVPGRWPVSALHETYADADDILMIPHVGGRRCNLDFFDARLERLIEVASAWGHFPWFYQEAIARGYRVGVSAAGDEHRGRPGGGAPGVDVFGVGGGLTGFVAESLTPAAVKTALFARRTWATTGGRHVALLRCGDALQGDVVATAAAHRLAYRLLGDAGWEWVAAYTDHGLLWERNLHAEAGYSPTRLRVRWGGARVRDRYRWARWRGFVRCAGGLTLVGTHGFEHREEWAAARSASEVEVKSETYGDADGVLLEVDDVSAARLSIDLSIGSFNKLGSPLAETPHKPCPRVAFDVDMASLLRDGEVRHDLPGCELFVSIERVTDARLPVDVSGTFDVRHDATPCRAVYVTARQIDDAKVWTSPIFFGE
ncbi:MAG TPA: hypothetical protein VF624_11910 [Tepidisphaeraceae bacterium]